MRVVVFMIGVLGKRK